MVTTVKLGNGETKEPPLYPKKLLLQIDFSYHAHAWLTGVSVGEGIRGRTTLCSAHHHMLLIIQLPHTKY